MSYVINLLEALIVSYGLVELCNISKKKLFFILNTMITFLITNFFDCIDQNFISLISLDEIIWLIIVFIFTDRQLYHNLYTVTIINLICGLSATLPIMFIYKYNSIYAGLAAKFIHFVLTYGFIKFRKKYDNFESSYWLMLLIIIFLSDCISAYQDEMILNNNYTIHNVLTNIFIFVIVGISLYFFHLIEKTNLEKERITKLYEKQKYQDLTYTFMKSAKDELDRFEHRMIYKIRNVKLEIEKHNYDEAIELIDNYRDEIHRINRTVYTGNGVFDTSMMLKLKELEYDVTPCFTISSRDFYNNVQFMNLILELLDAIHVKSLSLIIKEEKNICIVQCVGKDLSLCFDEIKHIFDKKIDFAYKYQMQENDSIDLFTLKIRMEDE